MRDYFCGWYFRCQSDSKTLAVIPAIHKYGKERSCSIQLITDRDSWNIPLPYTDFRKGRTSVQLAGNRFGENGVHLELHTPDLTANGCVSFGPFTPIKYDIMGPFAFIPFMECRHSVLSMKHAVNGTVHINGTPYVFQNGIGYLEGDRGRSFPKEYAWTQCSLPDGALMLSVADIPLCGFHFTGVIGVILWKGTEYRLATYLGAKAIRIRDGEIIIQQGNMRLTVRVTEQAAHPLCAPRNGSMVRTIHENASCTVYCEFRKQGQLLFRLNVPNAAFEYEYPN